MRRVGNRKKEQESVYLINSQMMASMGGAKSLVLSSIKPLVGKNKEKVKSRHAVPIDI